MPQPDANLKDPDAIGQPCPCSYMIARCYIPLLPFSDGAGNVDFSYLHCKTLFTFQCAVRTHANHSLHCTHRPKSEG